MELRQIFALTVCFFTSCSDTIEPCPKPARVGRPYTFIETIDDVRADILWIVNRVTVAKCYTNDSRCEIYSPDKYSSNMTSLGDRKYKVTLTVNNVDKRFDKSNWTWTDGTDDNKGVCEMRVYSFDSSPVCEELQLTEITSTQTAMVVSWTCRIAGFFPQFLCQFRYQKDNGNHDAIVSSSSVTSAESTCTMTLPVKSLSPGKYTFNITVYPDLPNSSPSLGTSAESRDMELELPVSMINEDCPEGNGVKDSFIRKGTTATCKCRLTVQGNPPGKAQWLRESDNAEVGEDQSDGTDILTLSYGEQGATNPVYICRGSSDLGQETIKEANKYRPQFAYGPSGVSMTMIGVNNPPFNFCKPSDTFDLYCDIVDVNPKPSVTLEGDTDKDPAISNVTINGNYYRYKFQVTPKSGGDLKMKCVASNTVFSDLTKDAEATIKVKAPPRSPPIITVNTGGSIENGRITGTSGQEIVLQCRVEGGHPPVSEVTFGCLGNDTTTNGISASTYLSLKKDMNDMTCSCWAEHETKCYGDSTNAVLNVQYAPTLTQYNVGDSGGDRIELDDGDEFKFSCEATGNPKPGLSIRGQRSQKLLDIREITTGDYSMRGEITQVMKCKHADTFHCTASNKVSNVEKSIAVFVKCVPELPNASENNRKYTHVNATDFEIEIKINGYPEPTAFVLSKLPNHNSRRKRSVSSEVEQDDYMVSYEAKDGPEGLVVLTMYGLVESDSGDYVLKIENSLGHLDYRFSIQIVTKGNPCSLANADDECNHYIIAVVVTVFCALLSLVLGFLIGVQCEKRRLCRKSLKKVVMLQPSPDYEETSIPLAEAYVGVDEVVRPVPNDTDTTYEIQYVAQASSQPDEPYYETSVFSQDCPQTGDATEASSQAGDTPHEKIYTTID